MALKEVACLNVQGIDVILFEVENRLSLVPDKHKEARRELCQRCASSHGLTGKIVLVWRYDDGSHSSYGSPEWKAYARHLRWKQITDMFTTPIECDY